MRTSAGILVGAVAALLAAAWVLRAEDPRDAGDAGEDPKATARSAWNWQCRVIVDRPRFSPVHVGADTVPAGGKPAVVLVLGPKDDPAPALKDLEDIHRRSEGLLVAWVAPDEASAANAKRSAPESIPGTVSPETCALVPVPVRPALLVVSQDGRIAYAHLPGFEWSVDLVLTELSALANAAASPSRSMPPPSERFQSALSCAACHRAQFVDWLFTPHSEAYDDLVRTGKDEEQACLPCHVTGMNKDGGFSKPLTDRRLADVQCGACHDPDRTHTRDRKIRKEEYPARCRMCHQVTASISADIRSNLPQVSHPFAKRADNATYDLRQESIGHFREHTYFEFCARTSYVGSAACKPCHSGAHADWSRSPHAQAFETLRKTGRSEDRDCVKCHVTGSGHEGGFQDEKSTPGMAGVGCESCHGPGKLHVQAATREEQLATIFRFDEKCPSCVVQRICAACHDRENDPEFELGKRLNRVRHGDR